MDSMNSIHQIKYLYNLDDLSAEVRKSNVGDIFVTVDERYSKKTLYMCVVGYENLSAANKTPYWMEVMNSEDPQFEKLWDSEKEIIVIPKLEIGDKVYVPNEKRPYKVRCRDNRYIICTKPINLYHTVLYFIIDLREGRRGPDNMVFCSGYETDEQCRERLRELQEGKIEVSWRRSVKLDVLVQ